MTTYRERHLAGVHANSNEKKDKDAEQKASAAAAKRAERSTTSKDVKGL